MRYIEGEPFEMNEDTKRDVLALTSQKKGDLWPEELFAVVKQLASKLKSESM
ncbi:MAG: hypothetical protein KJ583_02210 [Nanoarchaeota archaeon]|nr:hypothetical protein [Nanoarchaeota archaeon]MBU1604108.1 hypothetical protein [Nanoarchaeota archaeon]